MTQYTLHKDQKKVHAVDHGYTPMHSPENFFRYMKQGMQTLCLRWVLGLGHCVWFVCCCCSIVVALATLHRFAQDREQTVPWQAVFLHKDISTCTRPTNLPKANNSCKNTVHTCSFLMYCYTCCSAFYWAKIGTLQYFSRF